jgi:uncharacterized protein
MASKLESFKLEPFKLEPFKLWEFGLGMISNPETRSMLTRDGVRLDADVYYPPTLSGNALDYPVLLMRQPYGRAIASTVVYAHPIWYAAQGYIVVIQDVRGRGTSDGDFNLFGTEIEDGYDAVMWAATLPRANGKVGMYGFSYQGMTQVYAAVNQPEPLKTICPAMLAYDVYEDWAYEGNVFCFQSNLGWALQLAAESARLKQDQAHFLALSQAAKQGPIAGEIPVYPEILKRLAPDSFYHEWISRDRDEAYWQIRSPKTYLDAIAPLPMLHIGGWFDPYLRGTLNLYDAMRQQQRSPQHLIIGPWAHLPWGRRAGAIDFGAGAVSDCDRAQVRWFDYWLKDDWLKGDWLNGEGRLDESAATWFEMGTNVWVKGDRIDALTHQSWSLETTGLTSMRDGQLVAIENANSQAVTQDVIVHDPWRPVPSLGGHAASPAGVFDRAHLDDRSDVLTYTTAPLTQELLIQGVPTVKLHFQTDAKTIDLHGVLSQCFPDGRVLNISQGVKQQRELDSNRASDRVCIIHLQSTSIRVPIGNCLRVSVSLSNFPAYAMNGGTGDLLYETRSIDYQIITLYLDGGVLTLPIADW